METYDDLGALIGTVEFDSEALIAGAVAGGRRRQRRRRSGAGAGVLAVGALVVVASLHVAGSPGADGTAVTGQPSIGPDGRVLLPSAQLTDTRLMARLPVPGDLVSSSDTPDVNLERTIDPDGSGVGSVFLTVGTDTPLSQSELAGAAHKCHEAARLNGPESCKALDNGWVFTFAVQPGDQGAPPKSLDWNATLVAKDGTSVQVRATNFVTKGDPTRQAPVLDLDQIVNLATDPVWFQPAP